MFKKILLVSSIIAVSSSAVFAATPYVGVGLGVGGYKSQPGIVANLFGGDGLLVGQNQNIYLGGELNASVANYSNYSTGYGLGASFIPGVMLSKKAMLYGRLGLDSVYVPHKTDTLTYGAQYGLGLQANLTTSWDVRGEYVYSGARSNGQYNVGLLYKFD